MYSDPVETIPLRAWIWLWMELAEELGPERAAELCGQLRYRIELDQPPVERELGADWRDRAEQPGEERQWHHTH